MRLAGKVAVITGGGSGFGRATAMRFATEGARVVIADVDEGGATRTAELIAAAGGAGGGVGADVVIGDISTKAGADRAVAHALERFDAIDVLVNNAGIAQTDARDTWDTAEDTWDRVVQVNLKSVYLCSRAAIPSLLQSRGAVVNVASIAASVCVGGAAYAATKGAIRSYTRHVAIELARRGVRVNCVSPGFMSTPMSTGERLGLSAEEQAERIESFAARVPMKRAGTVDDIANAILFLASDEAGYITGQELVVDGGYVVR
jgi:NAD(P)-dependent dehydrogenase (short-subunit alcohol dehydrogenase family)